MNAAPPKLQPSGSRAVVLIVAGTALVIAATVFFFNPTTHHFYPVCQFHQLTGLNCPGCGMTRSAYSLLHGDWRTALHDNALFVAVLGGLALRGGWLAVNRARGRRNGEFVRAQWLWWLLAVTLVFTVLRNLPAFAFLSP